MTGYSKEQLRRKAWLQKYDTPAGYYEATEQERNEVENEINNNKYGRQHFINGTAN